MLSSPGGASMPNDSESGKLLGYCTPTALFTIIYMKKYTYMFKTYTNLLHSFIVTYKLEFD